MEALSVVIPVSILSWHYFNQSKYYLRSHHFHQQNTYQAGFRYFHDSNFYFSHQASFSLTEHLLNKNSLHSSSSQFSYTMIYFNNPAFTFNILILINLSSKRPAPKSHVPIGGHLWPGQTSVGLVIQADQKWPDYSGMYVQCRSSRQCTEIICEHRGRQATRNANAHLVCLVWNCWMTSGGFCLRLHCIACTLDRQ